MQLAAAPKVPLPPERLTRAMIKGKAAGAKFAR